MEQKVGRVLGLGLRVVVFNLLRPGLVPLATLHHDVRQWGVCHHLPCNPRRAAHGVADVVLHNAVHRHLLLALLEGVEARRGDVDELVELVTGQSRRNQNRARRHWFSAC